MGRLESVDASIVSQERRGLLWWTMECATDPTRCSAFGMDMHARTIAARVDRGMFGVCLNK